MYQHLEFEEKRTFRCSGCGENLVGSRGAVCIVCHNTAAEWSAETENPLPTRATASTGGGGSRKETDTDEDSEDHGDLNPTVRKARISYRTDFELVILRHQELRRAFAACPDLNSRLVQAGPEIAKAVRSFWSKMRYRPVLSANGVGEGDLLTLMNAWAAIYIGLYEKKIEKAPDENKKLLAVHLRQKAVEFVGTLYKKTKDCIPDREVGVGFSLSDASVSMGRPFDLPARPTGATGDARPQVGAANADTSYRRRHAKLRTGSDAERRRDAKRLLEEGLAALTHEELVETLKAAVSNERFCPDAKTQARKLLAKVEACTPAARRFLQEEAQTAEEKEEAKKVCPVCATRNRPMDKTVLGYPQANSLPLVRAYTLSLIKGQRPFVEALGVVSLESLSRHTAYYRQAARALGLVAENRDESSSPTKFAFDLARTKPGSDEEKELFLQQITTAPSLRDVAWFFQTVDLVPSTELTEIIVKEKSRRPGFDHVNPATAERRVSTLTQWKSYILGLDTVQDEDDEEPPAAEAA